MAKNIKGTLNPNFKHGGKGTRLYNIWKDIKKRCYNENCTTYKYYGGRGIKMCNDWMDFSSFRDWSISNGYQDNLTIDRIDVDGNYSSSNCRWISQSEQKRNTRKNRFFVIEGEKITASQICEKYKISQSKFSSRINKLGWSLDDAIKNLDTKRGTNKTSIKNGKF